MAANTNDDDDIISTINITPFVDVVLVLLVIFMATAGILVNKGILIELPQAKSAERMAQQSPLQIAIMKNGSIMVNSTEVNIDVLKSIVKNLTQKTNEMSVVIAADKGVIYNQVVLVMDALRQEGVTDFALQLEH